MKLETFLWVSAKYCTENVQRHKKNQDSTLNVDCVVKWRDTGKVQEKGFGGVQDFLDSHQMVLLDRIIWRDAILLHSTLR